MIGAAAFFGSATAYKGWRKRVAKMIWPWGKKLEPEPTHGIFRFYYGGNGNRIDIEWEGDRLHALAEGLTRLSSNTGKGIEFNGCPECGAFGHGMERHKPSVEVCGTPDRIHPKTGMRVWFGR